MIRVYHNLFFHVCIDSMVKYLFFALYQGTEEIQVQQKFGNLSRKIDDKSQLSPAMVEIRPKRRNEANLDTDLIS